MVSVWKASMFKRKKKRQAKIGEVALERERKPLEAFEQGMTCYELLFF